MVNSHDTIPTGIKVLRFVLRTIGTFSPQLAGYIVFQLFQTPLKRMQVNTDFEPRVLTFTHQQRTITGYEWAGSGKSVLLVHGWESTATRFKALLRLLVEQDYHVFAMDAPAHGASEGRQTNPVDYGDVLYAFTQLTGGIDTIIAPSFGGAAAMNALNSHPEFDVDNVVLIGAVNHPYDAVQFFSDVFDLSPAVAEQMAEQMRRNIGDLDDVSSAAIAHSRSEHALIIHDAEDKIVPVSAGRATSAAWEGARYIETEGLGHRRILNDKTVLSQVMDFIGKDERVSALA